MAKAKKRAAGEGAVRKRGKQYEGRHIVGHKADGKPIYRYVYAKTQREVLAKLRQSIELYHDIELTEDSSMTVGEWLDRWLNDYKRSTVRESTYAGYRRNVENHIKPIIGDVKLSKLTTETVQRMYNQLKTNGRIHKTSKSGEGLSDTTINFIHTMFHGAMETAVKAHLIVKNPTSGTVVRKPNSQEMQVLTDEEMEKFLALVDEDRNWRDFFYTELTTGLRRGEICGLKWTDFDEQSGKLSVRRSINPKLKIVEPKTQSGIRTILLPASTAQRLRERRKRIKSEWIFPNLHDRNRPLSPSSTYTKLKWFLRRANLPNIRFHDLRHTFATHAIASGVDPKTLSGILGHSGCAMTLDRYSHVTTDMQKQALDIMNRFVDEMMGV